MSLDERLSLMTEVADTKIVLGRPIEDRGREARVLAAAAGAARREAKRRGVEPTEPNRVEAFYRAQIEAAKSIQRARRESLARAPAPSDESARVAARRTLEERIRPALIALGDRIALLVVACADAAPPPDGLLRGTLARHALPEDDLRALETAFRALFRAAAESARPPRPAPATPDRAPSA
jgi:chorismate mutase